MPDKVRTLDPTDPLLVEMRKRFTYAMDEWREIREEGTKDIQVVAGDPWDSKDKRQRIAAGRPALALDEIGQYVNQLVNDVREHKRAIQVTPIGNGATDQTAEFRQNLIRQIEYRSNAQHAYTTAFENAVQRSYGFLRITSKYTSDEGFDQELLIEPIVNPDMVLIDPDFQRPDGSDMQWAFVYERWPLEQYRRRWPKAVMRDAAPELCRDYKQWVQPESIQLAEYWTIQTTRTKLYALKTPEGLVSVSADDLAEPPAKETIAKERWVETPTVKKYLTNGVEILEETEWGGTSIPIVCDLGKVLYVDDGSGPKRKILSLVRLARDPYMLYCYYRTCEAELVGMTPKFPYFVRRGSLLPDELLNLQKSLHEPIAVIQVEQAGDTLSQPPELPVRQPYEPPIQALEIGAESARRAIQAAMGSMPLPTQAQRQNEKSGIALDKIRDTTQHGTYHFIDHYEAMIQRAGVLLEELIPKYYDTARDVTVRLPDNRVKSVRINDTPPPGASPNTATAIPVDQGDHDVTLSTGPSYASEREAASAFADTLIQNENAWPILGDLVVKLKNLGPLGDEMAERLLAVAPPPIQALAHKDQPNQLPPPEQLAASLQAAQQQIQQLTQLLQTKQLDLASKERIALHSDQTALEKQKIATSGTMAVGLAKVDAENQRSFVEAFESKLSHDENFRLHFAKVATDAMLQHQAAATDLNAQALDHAHERVMAIMDHQHALAQGQQAADLAPEPAQQPSA